MDCEICGLENAKNIVLLDGQKMLVCDSCSDLGEKITQGAIVKANKLKPLQTTFSMEESDFSLIEGFGERIRIARQKKGLQIKELAQQIFEKESYLHKIEQGKHPPDERLARKLEKFFGIKLIEREN